MAFYGGQALTGSLGLLLLVTGCGEATTRMQPGVPLEVRRGYCFLSTDFKQQGREVNRSDTLKRLGRYERSSPYVSAGNGFALGSIAATVVGTTAFTVGLMGANDTIEMDQELATALIATGLGVGVLSWVLCITSDGKYVSAAEAYNAGLSNGQLNLEEDDPSAPDDVDRNDIEQEPGKQRSPALSSEPP